jgi:hypothetical protein
LGEEILKRNHGKLKNFKRLHGPPSKKIPVIGVVFLFVLTAFSAANVNNADAQYLIVSNDRAIVWNVTVSFNEPGGAYDTTIFGEAPDAHDGPPPDIYDVVKPPAPIPPYIRAWFNDNLPAPYNLLWEDYRHYPGITKVWNLTVQWVPSDYVTPTTLTISWNPAAVNNAEYNIVRLCNSTGVTLKNMLVDSSYTFNCPANIPQIFKINCLLNHPPNTPNTPTPPHGATNVIITTDLQWHGGDPDGDPVTYDVYFGTVNPPPKVVSNQSSLIYNPGTLDYLETYYWKIVAWDTHQATAVGPVWNFTTKPDTIPPTVSITSPQKGFLYINLGDIIVLKIPFLTTLVLGKIDVTVNAFDNQTGIEKVEFFVDNESKWNDTLAPYDWMWTEHGLFFPYMLKVVAYDNFGNKASAEMKLWKIF